MATESDPERSEALEVALSYYQAWTEHDFDRAMSFIAGDIVCDAPAGLIEGADAFRAFMGPFSQIVTRSELIGAFGDDDSALVMYGTDTLPVQNAPGAEYVTVTDRKIGYMRIIFDSAPFETATDVFCTPILQLKLAIYRSYGVVVARLSDVGPDGSSRVCSTGRSSAAGSGRHRPGGTRSSKKGNSNSSK